MQRKGRGELTKDRRYGDRVVKKFFHAVRNTELFHMFLPQHKIIGNAFPRQRVLLEVFVNLKKNLRRRFPTKADESHSINTVKQILEDHRK